MNKIYQKTLPAGKNAGFTLIELLVVVLIIGILAAVALPKYQVAVEKARAAEPLSVLKTLRDAQEIYYMANGEYATDLSLLDVEVPESKNFTYRWETISVSAQSKTKPYLLAYRPAGNGGQLVCGSHASSSSSDFAYVRTLCAALGADMKNMAEGDGGVRWPLN